MLHRFDDLPPTFQNAYHKETTRHNKTERAG